MTEWRLTLEGKEKYLIIEELSEFLDELKETRDFEYELEED